MTKRYGWAIATICVALVALLSERPVLAAEPILFDEVSSGILELSGQRRLRVEDVVGTVFVRAGKEGELRYAAADRSPSRTAHPIALWLQGNTIIFRPVEGAEADEIVLEISLSDGVDLVIDQVGGKIQVAGIGGATTVSSSDALVDIRGALDTVRVEAIGGSVRLENLPGLAELTGRQLESVEIARLQGGGVLDLVESPVNIDTASGRELQIALDRSPMVASALRGNLNGSASESRIELSGMRGGVELELEDSPLQLSRCNGKMVVYTDADVEFQAGNGSLTVEGYAASVRGDGLGGALTVTTQDAEIQVENVGGPLVVRGDSIQLSAKNVGGDVDVETIGSQVFLAKTKGAVRVTNEFGDVEVHGVNGDVTISNLNGDVTAAELAGALNLISDGALATVSWVSLPRDRDSNVENRSGELRVAFPTNARGRVEAQAQSIECGIEGFQFADSGGRGSVLLNRGSEPTINLSAAGQLWIEGGQ